MINEKLLENKIEDVYGTSSSKGYSQNYLNNHLFSGSYNDLIDKPTIPTINNTYGTSQSDGYSQSYINGLFAGLKVSYTGLGDANNSSPTKNLVNDSLTNYDFIMIECGYGYNRSYNIVPMNLFRSKNSNFHQCYTYTKTYNSADWVSIDYISDTSFKINCSIGTDTTCQVYGVKIETS